MPNHMLNEITLEGNPYRINHLLQTVKFDDGPVGTIDFNRVIPEPPNLPENAINKNDTINAIFDAPFEEKEMKDDNGFIIPIRYLDWYGWRVKYWGTKWNSYYYVTPVNQDPHTWSYTIVFNTAWTIPEPVILELSRMFPDVLITLRYAEEMLNCNAGHIMYYGGRVIDDKAIDRTNEEAAWLCAASMWNKYYGNEEETN